MSVLSVLLHEPEVARQHTKLAQTTIKNSVGETLSAISITSGRDLYSFANYINNGTLNPSTNAKLTSDMYMGGVEWTPIGGNGKDFIGTFDGGGHTIYDLHSSGTVQLPFEFGGETINFGGCALFGSTYYDNVNNGPKSMVKNLNIVNSTSDASPAAAVAIYGYDVIVENVHVSGTIKAPTNVSGIFWYSTGSVIRNCTVKADLITTGNASSTLAGGFVAQSSGSIYFYDCEYSGTIKQTESAVTKKCYAGFLIAYCYEYFNYFENFTVGPNSKIIGNPTSPAFMGEAFDGNPVTNALPLHKNSDSSVYTTGTNLYGHRAYASGSQEVRLINLGL